VDTNDNPPQARADQNAKDEGSVKSSAAPVKRRNGNKGYGQRKSIVPMSSEDPLADRQPHSATPGVSLADTIRTPEPLHLRSTREGRHKPVMHVPSPPAQDTTGQTASQSHSAKNARPAKRAPESTTGRNSPSRAPRDDSSQHDSPNDWPILAGIAAGVVSLVSMFVFALIRR